MNEQAINKVISKYAIEQANMRVALETVVAENEKLKKEIEELKGGKNNKEEGE